MSYGNVLISMPKFETEYTVSKLSEKMETVGIAKLFATTDALKNSVTPEAPASYINMIHKTAFKVMRSEPRE